MNEIFEARLVFLLFVGADDDEEEEDDDDDDVC